MEYQRTILANGLRVINIPMPSVKSVTVLVLIGAGSRYESKKISGLSHFLEHMAFKGTKRRPTAFSISSLIEGMGGEFNAYTSKDQTGFYIKAAAKNLPTLVDVLSDMLLNSKFDPQEIDRERGVIVEEINLYEDTPSRKIWEVFEELLYGDTPLGRDVSGEKRTILKINRQDFLDYIGGLYAPKNAVIVIAGGIGANAGENSIKKYLGGWENRQTLYFEKIGDLQTKPAVKVVYKKTEQAHLAVGVRGYSFLHPDRYAIDVLSTILGGGMSSRLFIQVRERRGLAYYVHSQAEHYVDVGHFFTVAGVDLLKIDEAIQVIINEYDKLAEKIDVSEDELARAKEFLKGRLVLEIEDSRFLASVFAVGELLEGKIKTPEEIMAKIDAVTLKDLRRVASDIFKKEKLNLAVIGPYKDNLKNNISKKFRQLLML
jgi:predicted Zn-dependent peptidase